MRECCSLVGSIRRTSNFFSQPSLALFSASPSARLFLQAAGLADRHLEKSWRPFDWNDCSGPKRKCTECADLPGLRRDCGDVLCARDRVPFHHRIEHFDLRSCHCKGRTTAVRMWHVAALVFWPTGKWLSTLRLHIGRSAIIKCQSYRSVMTVTAGCCSSSRVQCVHDVVRALSTRRRRLAVITKMHGRTTFDALSFHCRSRSATGCRWTYCWI